ncbi:MAG: GerMN domain-containing protein [Velocimicrobium sp.]
MKKIVTVLSLFLFVMLLVGCKESTTKKGTSELDSDYFLYYLDNKETQVVSESYKPKGTTMEEQIEEYTDALREKKPSNLTYKKALPDYVTMNVSDTVENEQLTLDFDSNYLNLTGASEVLCRAAIVKTFCQIEGIEYVQFIVDGQPLKDSYDLPIGFMQAEDFIDNTGGEVKYEQNATVVLYFSDSSGNSLVETRVKIKYDGTIPLEQLVLNQLMKGPSSIEGVKKDELLLTIPENAKLNKVTVKDGVCYVDFSSEFLKGVEGVSTNATIYSVVNTLVEISEVNKVQFAIDGEQVKDFKEGIELDIPLERNLDLVKKSE